MAEIVDRYGVSRGSIPEKFHRAFPTEADFQEAVNIEVERRAGAKRKEMLTLLNIRRDKYGTEYTLEDWLRGILGAEK